MRYEQALEAIRRIESGIDTTSFWVGDVPLWPVYRILLWPSLVGARGGNAIERKPPKALVSPISAPGSPWRDRGLGVRANELRLKWRMKYRFRQHDILCFSRLSDHTENFTEGRVDRLIDPFIDLCVELGLDSFKVSAGADSARPVKQLKKSEMVDLDYLTDRSKAPLQSSSVNSLHQGVQESLGTHPPDVNAFNSFVRRLLLRARLLEILLGIVRPKLVVLSVFYAPESLAMTVAAHRQGIPVLDIQHGKQGNLNAMYGYWENLPECGTSVLPDTFWHWGSPSAQQSKGTNTSPLNAPRSIVGGNLWLSAWKGGQIRLTPHPEALFSRINSASRCVLVVLQPIDDMLPEFILEAMRVMGQKVLWLIRLHPQRLGDIPQVVQRLQSVNADFEIESVTRAPLYPVIRSCHRVVTAFSSVAFEALELGVLPVITHPTGWDLYADEIQRAEFLRACSADELVEAIELDDAVPFVVNHERYIETDRALAKQALLELVHP